MSLRVRVEAKGEQLHVRSPYNKVFVAGARNLGGQWAEPDWVFDPRNERLVRELCQRVYGTDGESVPDTVSVEIEWSEKDHEDQAGFVCCGRVIAAASGRDSGAKLGAGVVVLNGRFNSGGSMKNWTTTCEGGTKVLLHDIPRGLLTEYIERQQEDAPWRTYTVIEPAPSAHAGKRQALLDEQTRLTTRLAEIERELGDLDRITVLVPVDAAPTPPSKYGF